ncbi:MAG: TIGR01244 family sulfur transferase [Amphiplicatus sp.]
MSSKFRELAEGFFVAPQISPDDVRAAAAMGVTLVINNRPDGEEPGQPSGAEIEKAAEAAGLVYAAIPIRGSDISDAHIDAFDTAVSSTAGAILAFCRSGTRSTLLRAFVRARAGDPISEILESAAAAGYDLSPLAGRLAALAKGYAINSG